MTDHPDFLAQSTLPVAARTSGDHRRSSSGDGRRHGQGILGMPRSTKRSSTVILVGIAAEGAGMRRAADLVLPPAGFR